LRPRLTTGLPFSLAQHECAYRPALVPTLDEFPMILEGVSVFFSRFLWFSETFLRIGSELRGGRGFLFSLDLRSLIGPARLENGRAITLA
jgi:hypothetical protein